MDKLEHDFDYIIRWASLTDSQINDLYSSESKKLLDRVLSELADVEEQKQIVSKVNFVFLVRLMHKRWKEGSRSLSIAINSASKLAEDGRLTDAELVYKNFLESNKSQFYRQIALDCIRALSARR